MAGGHHSQGRGEMCLAHARRAEEYDVFAIFQEPHGGQFVDLSFVNGGLEGEVKVIQ